MKQLKQLQQDWNDLAEIDPMWAICSRNDKAHRKWNAEEFFQTGKVRIKRALGMVRGLGIPLANRTALDFGCGIGRLTQALAEEFETCYGVDVSSKMVNLANRFNHFGDKCKYMVNARDDLLIFGANTFDFIYTEQVLQHMPSELMKKYIGEFIRVLKPGGAAMFHVPVQRLDRDERTMHLKSLPRYHPKRILNKLRGMVIGQDITDRYYRLERLRLPKQWLYDKFGFRPDIPMYHLEESEIHGLIGKLGSTVMHVVRDVDGEMLCGEFVVVKPCTR